MKNIIKILPIVFSILLFSCKEGVKVDVLGNWKSSITMMSELASPQNPELTIANVYIKQTNEFSFSEDGKYTRTVSQIIERADSFTSEYTPEQIVASLSQNEMKIILYGNYKVSDSTLKLDAYEIEKNGVKIPYDEYYETDKSQGPADYSTKIRRDNDELFIEGVKFKKN